MGSGGWGGVRAGAGWVCGWPWLSPAPPCCTLRCSSARASASPARPHGSAPGGCHGDVSAWRGHRAQALGRQRRGSRCNQGLLGSATPETTPSPLPAQCLGLSTATDYFWHFLICPTLPDRFFFHFDRRAGRKLQPLGLVQLSRPRSSPGRLLLRALMALPHRELAREPARKTCP